MRSGKVRNAGEGMDIIGLGYFVSAAEHLNFTKAADECCITQTAMSLHVAKIEKELGFQLFFREHRAVRLTPGGQAFYQEALKITRQYKESVQRCARVAAGSEGMLRIGFTNYIERTFLPDLIARFHTDYPRIEIILNKNSHNRGVDDLKDAFNDVCVVFPYDVEDYQEIALRRLDTYRICAVVHRNHPLAERTSIRMKELEKSPVVVHSRAESPRLYGRVRTDWEACFFDPETIIEADSADSMLFMVEAGFGNALMPSYVSQLQNDRIRVIPLEDVEISVHMAIASLKHPKNPAVKLFLDALQAYRNEMNPSDGGKVMRGS